MARRGRLLLVATAAACAACGGTARRSGAHGQTPPAFSWLSRPAPLRWPAIRIRSGAALTYPPGWRLVSGDPGSATAVLLQGDGGYLGYLNLTPRQRAESLGNWSSFRVAHNREEGDTHVTLLAAAHGLRFRTGKGSCVEDDYETKTAARFREIACLVTGSRTTSVIVGAAPPDVWRRMAPTIEQAMTDVRT